MPNKRSPFKRRVQMWLDAELVENFAETAYGMESDMTAVADSLFREFVRRKHYVAKGDGASCLKSLPFEPAPEPERVGAPA